MNVSRDPIRRGWCRTIDLAGASLGLALFAPVIVVVSLLSRLCLGSPVLYRSQRAGQGGAPITVVKFRTMTNECDSEGRLLPDEERLTAFGSWLRRSSLDELPQLWTVLRGDMSLIGPRPLPMSYNDRYSPEQRRRLEVKPGLTGWSQVNGRNALAWPDKLAYDVWYVDHASTWLDIKILARTVAAVLRRDGVSADDHVTMPEFMGER